MAKVNGKLSLRAKCFPSINKWPINQDQGVGRALRAVSSGNLKILAAR
jgi:hypothetical protein